MSQIDSTLLEIDSYTKNANSVKDTVLSRLVTDGVITEEQEKTYAEKWQVVIVKRSWFQRWFDRFSKSEPDNYIYKFVKFED